MNMLEDLLRTLLLAGVELSIEEGKPKVRAPDGALSPETLATLRHHKDEILHVLPALRFDAPLSVGQEGLWGLQKSAPDSSAYNVGIALHLVSESDHGPALRRALQKLVNRHPLLRTTYTETDGTPRQVVQGYRGVDLREIDAAQMSWADIVGAASAVHLRPFDLEAEGGFRASLFRRGPRESVLLLCVHHVAVDGWSFRRLVDELLRLYEADGRANPLPPVKHTYHEFVRLQREMLDSRGEELRRAWMDELKDAPLVLDLPVDRARPPVQTFRGATLTRALDPSLVTGLRALARAQGTTLYTVFLAAFQVLLHRYCGQEDFCVGSAAALRDREELAEIFGYMVNLIVLRARISTAEPPDFLSFVEQTRQTVLRALDRQDYPFLRLVQDMLDRRDPARPPVVQALFSYQRTQMLSDAAVKLMAGAPVNVSDARIKLVPLPQEITEVELIFEVTEHPSSFELGIRYNVDLFDAATIERMAGHFTTLLGGIVADPCRPVSQLPLLDEAEREQLLVEWNRTEAPFSREACIHELFEAHADRVPEAIAIVDHCRRTAEGQGAAVTYGELERRANQVAHRLRRLGVGPDTRVGLYLERDTDLIVGLLGILKAGGAFVVLDPEHPQRRLAFLLKDTDVPVVLTRRALMSSLPETSATVVDMEQGIAGEPAHRPESGVKPDNLAYVLYTSGSTGEPNGVLIEHRGLVNGIEGTVRILEIEPAARLMHLLSFNFDGAIGILFWMLCAGGTVYLAPRNGDFLGQGLIDLMEREAITHTLLPPTMIAAMSDAELPSLHTLVAGGERCSADLVARWGRGRRFFNMYGPTEVSIFATSACCVADGSPPSIGRPNANLQAIILDRWGQLTPPGVVGELYLGGVGVARGYLHRPELTARKFMDNPFGKGRLYRTGDMVRYRMTDSGPPRLDFVGRLDHQVKMRGYRIELSEVENALRASPRVHDAVVTVHERSGDGRSSRRLVAYVTPATVEDSKERESEQIASWNEIYDQVGDDAPVATGSQGDLGPEYDPTLDIRGWKSSYTGEDIPQDQMRAWAESTIARILDLAPQEVLEIGCGTGMLLSRLAPHARRYRGTDLSRYALAQLEMLKAHVAGLENVHVSQQPAHDLTGLTGDRFDTVILNSVVQYFPSADYLVDVIDGLLGLIGSTGTIFLGDIRNLALLETYHAAVAHSRAGVAVPRHELRGRVQRALINDNELVLHPLFFNALRARFPRIVGVEIAPKRGAFKNELTLFRYDVTLQIGGEPAQEAPIAWRDVKSEGLTLAWLRDWIAQSAPGSTLGLRGIPNARLHQENDLRRWVAGDDDHHHQPWEPPPGDPWAWEPESLFALPAELSCQVRVSWAAGSADGSFDAIVTTGGVPVPRFPLDLPIAPRRWTELANDPLQGRAHRELEATLHRELREALPSHLVPSAIVVLPALPLNINGKVDLRALPPPMVSDTTEHVEPQTDAEHKLAEVWCSVLGIHRVGIHDNFFELGGDSLLVMQVVSRLSSIVGLEVPARVFLERPTIHTLARHIDTLRAAQQLTKERSPAGASRRESGRL
jgi:amino acid adenylation domain-containing protein